MWLETVLTFLCRCAENLNLIKVSLSHSGLCHTRKIHYLCRIKSHQLRCERIHRQRIEAGESEPGVDGSPAGGAVSFHGDEAVNNAEIGINLPRQMEHVVMQDRLAGEIVYRMCEPLVVLLHPATSRCGACGSRTKRLLPQRQTQCPESKSLENIASSHVIYMAGHFDFLFVSAFQQLLFTARP